MNGRCAKILRKKAGWNPRAEGSKKLLARKLSERDIELITRGERKIIRHTPVQALSQTTRYAYRILKKMVNRNETTLMELK